MGCTRGSVSPESELLLLLVGEIGSCWPGIWRENRHRLTHKDYQILGRSLRTWLCLKIFALLQPLSHKPLLGCQEVLWFVGTSSSSNSRSVWTGVVQSLKHDSGLKLRDSAWNRGPELWVSVSAWLQSCKHPVDLGQVLVFLVKPHLFFFFSLPWVCEMALVY